METWALKEAYEATNFWGRTYQMHEREARSGYPVSSVGHCMALSAAMYRSRQKWRDNMAQEHAVRIQQTHYRKLDEAREAREERRRQWEGIDLATRDKAIIVLSGVLPQRKIGDLFGLTPGRVNQIIKRNELRKNGEARKAAQGRDD